MARDMEDRIRRSLQARSGDVQPNPSTWETVQTRIRRRTWARWSVAGVTAAAVLLLAVLVLPGLLTQTRIDLGPADPLPGLTSGLVTTDGETLAVRDAGGQVLAEFDPPTEADDPLPITRVAVRPGSSGDELTVAYTRADQGCERVETGWVTAAGDDVTGGALGGGQGFCITDPVWSPEGDLLAWVEEHPDGDFQLAVHAWDAVAPDVGSTSDTRVVLGVPADVAALRATGWRAGGGGQDAAVIFAGWRGGIVGSYTLSMPEETAKAWLPDGDAPMDVALTPSAEVVGEAAAVSQRSRLMARSRPAAGGAEYGLTVDEQDGVVLSRTAPMADGSPDPRARGGVAQSEVPLAPEVLVPGDLDTGTAWLAARADTVVFGADGDAWTVRWEGDDWGELQALPGVVHADVLALGEAEPHPTPAPVALPYVSTDGHAITLHRPDGSFPLADAQEGDIIDFAVHPASTTDDVTVVWREGRGCDATLYHARVAGDAETPARALSATCPGRPAFAPDGTHLAWMAQPDLSSEEPAAGQPAGHHGLETLAWTDGPADSLVTFGVQAEQPETVAFDVADWAWTEGHGTPTAGTLHLVGYDSHGTPSAHTLPIERQGDGALALQAGATAQERPAIIEMDSHDNDGAAVGPSYVLGSVPGADPNTLRVTRSVDGDQAQALPLPDGLLTVYGGAAETDNVWMTARGGDVLLGDGADRAWHLPWTGDGWGELTELDRGVRFAVPLARPAADEPESEGDPPPEAEPAPDNDPAGLPARVAATRAAIREAAAAEDVDGLVQLAGEEFTSSFGGTENPRAFFQRVLAEGELDRLVAILDLPHGEQDGIYSWPFAHTRDLESLSSAELQSLETIATQEEIDSWFEFGGYAGWRAGIAGDGTWLYYGAGD